MLTVTVAVPIEPQEKPAEPEKEVVSAIECVLRDIDTITHHRCCYGLCRLIQYPDRVVWTSACFLFFFVFFFFFNFLLFFCK